MKAQALVARNIRKLRVAGKVSQESLAVDANIDRAYIGRLERGEVNATVAILERLAHALKCEIGEFFRPPSKGDGPVKPLRGGRRPKR
jgi:transcriptional regulator with XRE-family HTH domain